MFKEDTAGNLLSSRQTSRDISSAVHPSPLAVLPSPKTVDPAAPHPLELSPLTLPSLHLQGAAKLLVTGSPRKAAEYSSYFGEVVTPTRSDEEPREGQLLKDEALYMSKGKYAEGAKNIAVDKAKKWFEQMGAPVIVEDTWFSLDGIGGAPGPFFASFKNFPDCCQYLADSVHVLKNRDGSTRSKRAVAIVTLAYHGGEATEPLVWQGSVSGLIAPNERGINGDEWDRIFIPTIDDTDVPHFLFDYKKPSLGGRTFAQLNTDEQIHVSARKRAVDALRLCPIARELFQAEQ